MSCEFVFHREAGVSPQLYNIARVYATSPEGCFNICDEVTCSASHRACHPEAATFNYTAWGVEDIRLVRILPRSQVFATSILCSAVCKYEEGRPEIWSCVWHQRVDTLGMVPGHTYATHSCTSSMNVQMGYPVLLQWCWPSCNHISQSVYDKAPPMCVCPLFTWCALWRILRPSPFVFTYCKQSKAGSGEGLGTRLPVLYNETVLL